MNLSDAAVVEHRVSPPAAFRKSLAVLFHDEGLGKDVWHLHDERGLRPIMEILELEGPTQARF